MQLFVVLNYYYTTLVGIILPAEYVQMSKSCFNGRNVDFILQRYIET